MSRLIIHSWQLFWVLIALLLFAAETLFVLFYSPTALLRNLKTFPRFLTSLCDRWLARTSKEEISL